MIAQPCQVPGFQQPWIPRHAGWRLLAISGLVEGRDWQNDDLQPSAGLLHFSRMGNNGDR